MMYRRIFHRVNGGALTGALVGAVVVLLITFGISYTANRNRIDANQDAIDKTNTALAALCAQRADLDRRIYRSAVLLRETQGDPTIYGIPRVVFVEAQRQNQITRHNLEILDCP